MISKACLETYAALDYREVHPGTWTVIGISIFPLATKCWSNSPGLEWREKEVKGDLKLKTVSPFVSNSGQITRRWTSSDHLSKPLLLHGIIANFTQYIKLEGQYFITFPNMQGKESWKYGAQQRFWKNFEVKHFHQSFLNLLNRELSSNWKIYDN